MYSLCYIKNIDSENHIILGVELIPDQEYQIPDNKRISASNDSILLQLISDLKINVGNGSTYYSTLSEKINRLKNIDEFEVDSQGRQIIRTAAGQKGWTYLAKFIEFETSKLGSLKCRKNDNTNCSDVTLKLFNGSNQEVTDSAYENTIVRTEILIKLSTDFELISGHIHQITCPTSDIFVNVLGGIIELGSNYTKDFVTGMNLAFMGADENIITDGRASKYMTKDISGVPYQGNQLKFIIFHDAGINHRIMTALEMFRA